MLSWMQVRPKVDAPTRQRARRSCVLPALALLAGCEAPVADGTAKAPRVDAAHAAALVRARIFADTPTMNPSVETPVVEKTPPGCFEELQVQVYEVTEGVRQGYAFLVDAYRATPLCGGFGGLGLHSCHVADLDRDGESELVFCWSWGSGIHRTELGAVWREGAGFGRAEGRVRYAGDLFLESQGPSEVEVWIGSHGAEPGEWTKDTRFGRLVFGRSPVGASLDVELAELSAEQIERVMR